MANEMNESCCAGLTNAAAVGMKERGMNDRIKRDRKSVV